MNADETSLTLQAQSEEDESPVQLGVEAAGGTGTIVLSGGDEAEGTVDDLTVRDTGEIAASGQLAAAEPAGGGCRVQADRWSLLVT